MRKMELICIPYAGGSVTLYEKWRNSLNPKVELCLIELAGRGTRSHEALYQNLHEAVDDIYARMHERFNIKETPFALFGYSMGSLIAYELAHKIKDLLGLNPHHIFFAAKQPPDYTSNNKILHTLPIPALVNELMAMGGTPSEIFQDPMLKEYFLPIIKSDLRITENYRYIRRESKLDCDFTIIDGIYDYMLKSPIGGWQNHSNLECYTYKLEGDHFLIHTHMDQILNIINRQLMKKMLPENMI